MSEFSHIEITIENVDTDGNRTRPTRWTCPSVDMGCTPDARVELRFAGEPTVIGGEPVEERKPDPGWLSFDSPDPTIVWTPTEGVPVYDPHAVRSIMDSLTRRTVGAEFTYSIDYLGCDGKRRTHRWTEDVPGTCADVPTEVCATEVPAQYPGWTRIGDTRSGWLFSRQDEGERRITTRFEPGATEAFIAQMLGATEAPRDVATEPKPGDKVIIRMVMVELTYEVDRVTETGAVDATVRNGRSAPRSETFTPIGWLAVCGMAHSITRADAAPMVTFDRDVATDPRVGDRVTVPATDGSYEVVSVSPWGPCITGRIACGGGAQAWWRQKEWITLCRTPGATIERAP